MASAIHFVFLEALFKNHKLRFSLQRTYLDVNLSVIVFLSEK